jgi:hypothetical protein
VSLSTYADLQAQIANFLARDDLTAYIPDMITLFEAAASRRLKVRPQETTLSIATTNGVGTLPTDYLGYRRVTWTGSPITDLTYVAPSIFQFDTPYTIAGTPQEFTIEGSSISMNPQDDTGLQMVYYQRTAAVSGALNWLYTNHPRRLCSSGLLVRSQCFQQGRNDQAALWLCSHGADHSTRSRRSISTSARAWPCDHGKHALNAAAQIR